MPIMTITWASGPLTSGTVAPLQHPDAHQGDTARYRLYELHNELFFSLMSGSSFSHLIPTSLF